MLDIIVHATPEQIQADIDFERFLEEEERSHLRTYTDARFTPDQRDRPGIRPAMECADDLFLIVWGSFGKPGCSVLNTAALHIARRFIDEMDGRGWYGEDLHNLGHYACAADDVGDYVRISQLLRDFVMSSSSARLADARMVVDRMKSNLTDEG